jgi:putative transposase
MGLKCCVSKSAWKTPRFTVDLRNLNATTYKDRYPIPRVQDGLDALGGKMYFSILDQTSSFHQIPIDSRDRDKTAFVTKSGQYRYQVMPMGQPIHLAPSPV